MIQLTNPLPVTVTLSSVAVSASIASITVDFQGQVATVTVVYQVAGSNQSVNPQTYSVNFSSGVLTLPGQAGTSQLGSTALATLISELNLLQTEVEGLFVSTAVIVGTVAG